MSLERLPGLTVARYGHQSLVAGHQLWDEMAWPLQITPLTEGQILSELYQAVVEFWSTRE